MANEASKVRSRLAPLLVGHGIDIGCGDDPITQDCVRWDKEQGDANEVRGLAPESFDWLFSSHALEHMPRPEEALLNWWNLVRPGGLMIVIVPSEDEYEQNVWPSTFNDEHCHSFTLLKSASWSPASRNLLDMVRQLPLVKVRRAEIIDERPAAAERRDWTLDGCICHIELVLEKQPQQYRLGSTLDQVVRCPRQACGRSCILVGIKGTVVHLRCEACGGVATMDLGTKEAA